MMRKSLNARSHWRGLLVLSIVGFLLAGAAGGDDQHQAANGQQTTSDKESSPPPPPPPPPPDDHYDIKGTDGTVKCEGNECKEPK